MLNLKDNISKYAIYFCLLIVAFLIIKDKNWNKKDRIIGADVISYYSYLPSFFIFNDIKLEKHETYKHGIFWPETLPSGAKVIKTSMGLSFLYSPFFFCAHFIAKITGSEAYGFSAIYKIGLLLSAFFYFFIGLFFMRKTLKIYFSERIVALTILAVSIGTNLLYYATSEATMSHVYNFALLNVFIWLTIKWHENQRIGRLLLIGALAGLITLVRPSNIIILSFFFLYKVYSKETLVNKLKLIVFKFHWIILMALAFSVIWIPQMLYWKEVTGNFFFYSYTGERFFFNNPHFIDGLFSYRKGWLVYTPIMSLALLGILLSFKKLKEHAWAISFFTLLNTYIVFSWWCWWYGGSFGMRALIDFYGMLAIPMALLFSEISKYKKQCFKIITGIVVLLILQNFLYTRKYKSGAIHWDSMTKEAFWHSYFRGVPRQGYWELIEAPDYEKAKTGQEKD